MSKRDDDNDETFIECDNHRIGLGSAPGSPQINLCSYFSFKISKDVSREECVQMVKWLGDSMMLKIESMRSFDSSEAAAQTERAH